MHRRIYQVNYAAEGAASGGATRQVLQSEQTPGQQGGQSPPPPPAPKALDAFADLWQPPAKPGSQGGNQGGVSPPPPPADSGQQQPSAVAEYLDKRNYFESADMAKLQTAFEGRDFTAFQAELAKVFRGFEQNSMGLMDKFGKFYQDKAIEAAVQKSGSQYSASAAQNSLFEKFPSLSLPALKPVAVGVLNSLLAKGKPLAEAITATNDYFVQLGQHVTKPPGSEAGRSGAGSAGDGGEGSKGSEIDFSSIFSGSAG